MFTIQRYLWILPFISFFTSYWLISRLYTIPMVKTPALIGIPISQAVGILSEQNLNVRIIKQKEDNDLPEGTIISQTPHAGQSIKAHQTVFCVISEHQKLQTPHLVGKTKAERENIMKQYDQKKVKIKEYFLPHQKPSGICLAQFPAPNEPLEQSLVTYISDGPSQLVIFPDLKNKNVPEVLSFFALYDIRPLLFHQQPVTTDHSCYNCIIREQKPLPGSLIDLSKPCAAQISVTMLS